MLSIYDLMNNFGSIFNYLLTPSNNVYYADLISSLNNLANFAPLLTVLSWFRDGKIPTGKSEFQVKAILLFWIFLIISVTFTYFSVITPKMYFIVYHPYFPSALLVAYIGLVNQSQYFFNLDNLEKNALKNCWKYFKKLILR